MTSGKNEGYSDTVWNDSGSEPFESGRDAFKSLDSHAQLLSDGHAGPIKCGRVADKHDIRSSHSVDWAIVLMMIAGSDCTRSQPPSGSSGISLNRH